MIFEKEIDDFTVSSNFEKFDIDYIYSFLTQSYWANGISKSIVLKSIKNSIPFGMFNNNQQQIGFARVITDESTFAYLADVFIDEDYRGLGLGKILVSTVLEHPDLCGLRRFLLATADAHSLYSAFGFKSLSKPHNFMEINTPIRKVNI